VRPNSLLAALLVAAAAGDAAAQAESWRYRVRLEATVPLVARVEVELPPPRREQIFAVRPRGAALNVASQVSDVSCDGVPLTADADGRWQIDGRGCARLAWQVRFRELTASGVNAADQPSLYDPRLRFWLFSEPASLLRPVDAAAHEGEIEFIGGGPVNGGAYGSLPGWRRIPGAALAPEYFAIGAVPVSTVRERQADLVYVNALGVSLAHLFGQHRRALGYLMKVSAVRFERLFRTTVVWLPGAPANGAGRAAGFRTLLANGPVEGGRLAGAEDTLAFLLHEQFHQMIAAELPLWADESLAQYYAIKALRRRDLDRDAVQEVERRFIDPDRVPRMTLRQAQMLVQQGDAQGLAALHTDGAAFWDRVDHAIQRRSGGFRTLDSLLPALLATRWDDDRIPPRVLELLVRHAGSDATDRLIERYVGR
jgi:hypothetical protein